MTPTFLSLPSQLLQAIADHIPSEHELRCLAQSHPQLDGILAPYIKARKDRSNLLISAIQNSKPPQLCQLLLQDVPTPNLVDIRDGIGRTPLMSAAESGHEAVVRTLLSAKYGPADVTLRSCRNRSVLWYAAKGGNVKIVQMMLDTGKLDHNAADNDGVTPFACAASEGHCEVMRFLISLEGADPDCRMYQGRTPLFLAAGNGKEEEAVRKPHYSGVVQQLLAVKGIDPDAADGHQRTPLIAAALRGHAEVVRLLLATGRVQLDARDHQGMTPLMSAAKFQRTPVVQLLLSTGQLLVDFDLSELRKGLGLFGPPKLDQSLVKLLDAYKKRDA